MSNFSKFGASALALALSIALVSPVTAKADIGYDTYSQDYDVDYSKTEDGRTTSEKYTNRATGATYTFDYTTGKKTGVYYDAISIRQGVITKMTVGTGDYGYYSLGLNLGDTVVGKVKFSGNISGKLAYSRTGEKVIPDWDSTAKQWFFVKMDGTKEYITLPENCTEDEWEAAKRVDNEYTYRIYGKKAGKGTIKYTVQNAAGTKKTYKVKVTVSDDARAFQSITYGGKSLQLNYNKGANNDNYYASQGSNKNGNDYLTKKSGKLKVKMGKNYKFIATYVIKPTDFETKTDVEDDSKDGYVDKTSYTYITRKATKGIDLNGDGDCYDTINGIREGDYQNYTFTKVGNNKKIKLNTSADKADRTEVRTYGSTGQYTNTTVEKYNDNIADTTVIIVYQNKITKTFAAYKANFHLRVSKK